MLLTNGFEYTENSDSDRNFFLKKHIYIISHTLKKQLVILYYYIILLIIGHIFRKYEGSIQTVAEFNK